MSSEGELVGGYLLRTLLGRGGIGEVWLALDTRREREVALKLLSGDLAGDPEFQARFAREARVTAQLASVHVIPVHDFGEIAGRPFLDMRLVRGGDLSTAIAAARSGMHPARAVTIATQLADALDAAHAAGLVHRDVKPANVLLAEHRGQDFCYLTDFGIVKIVHDTGPRGSRELTGAGVALGTTTYMAPELFTTGQASARSDVYALGCVFYEMLCGRAPYPVGDPAAMMYQHLYSAVPAASAHRPDLAAFDRVIATALAKDPAARFGTAGALADAAETALRTPVAPPTPPVSFAPPTNIPPPFPRPPAPPRRPWWRTRGAAIGSAVLAAVLVAALVVLLARAVAPSNPSAGPSVAPTPTSTVPAKPRARKLDLPLYSPLGIALTPDHKHAYVADAGSSGGTGSVAVVDLAKSTVTAAVSVGPDPNGLAVTPNGRTVYVANTGSDDHPGNTVSVIDTATNTVVTTIPTGPQPLGIVATPDGRSVYVTIGGSNPAPDHTVAVVDTATNTVTRTIPVGPGPARAAVSPDGRKVYVTDFGSTSQVADTVTVIDTATNTVARTVTVGDAPLGVAVTPDGTRAYVANNGTNSHPEGSVAVLDLTNSDQATTFIKSPLDGPKAVAITPDGKHVVVLAVGYEHNPKTYTASVIDTATNTVTGTVPVGEDPYAVVAADNRRAYLSSGSALWSLDIP